MIKKLKNNIKALNKKESSLLDFVLENTSVAKRHKISLNNPGDRRKLNKEKNREGLLKINVNGFNGQPKNVFPTRANKVFCEDKENINLNNTRNNLKASGKENMGIRSFFKPVNENCKSSLKVFKPLPKVTKIEFFDEHNKKSLKMNKFEEKDFEWTKSKILPKVMFMKVDNDVMTDDEQLKDAFNMMREKMKDAIKLIQADKDYLSKNLSRKFNFVKSKK